MKCLIDSTLIIWYILDHPEYIQIDKRNDGVAVLKGTGSRYLEWML